VAEFTTVRRIDLRVTHQAVRHVPESARLWPVRCSDAPMAGEAGVAGVQPRPQGIARRREVGLVIDRGSNHRRNVAEPQMQLMIKLRDTRGRRRSDSRALVALPADFRLRQQVVIDARAGPRRGVAGRAFEFQPEVNTM
jgi:hypothetical protein